MLCSEREVTKMNLTNLLLNYGEAVAMILFGIGFTNLLLQNNLIKKTPISEFRTNNRNVVATKLLNEDTLVYVGEDLENQIVLQSKKGYLLRFKTEEISTMKKNSQGTKAMELVLGDEISKAYMIGENLEVTLNLTKEHEVKLERIRLKKRGDKGIKLRK